MRKIFAYLFSITVMATGYANEPFPGRWIFGAGTDALYNASWVNDGTLPATMTGTGTISVVRGVGAEPFSRVIFSHRPQVSTMAEGDYWLYTLPVESLPAGTAIDFNATMSGQRDTPKYFIIEYFDGGEWKSVEEDLLAAAEDPALSYSYKISGLGNAPNYQHTTVMQTIRFENAITDGDVSIRCRAVGPYLCGEGQDGAANIIPPYGFTGSYVQNFGTSEPEDTKKVLLLGNSFSYYGNPAWMLKELAWREGHEMKMVAHFKGSQSLAQHVSLGMSSDAMDRGGYDAAFIQDQSRRAAMYGREDASKGDVSRADILAGWTAVTDRVLASSPDCRIIVEETWTFSAAAYGGFGDFATFDSYNDAGAKAIARQYDAWVSPIGPAFTAARGNGMAIDLYDTDNKHQSDYGAYLKVCVNYLTLYGEPFGTDAAACGLEPGKAAYLRSIAEDTVLGHENEYFIER
jgi:hypothetical protein